jgi:DNA repair exonuclease SbcCD ATPase subunit
MSKKASAQPAPPPDLQQAYDQLQQAYAELAAKSATPQAAQAQAHAERGEDLERQVSERIASETLQLKRERDDLLERCEQLEAKAEQSRNAVRVAQGELAAAKAEIKALRQQAPQVDPFVNDAGARNFLFVKGNPKDPSSPRERVRARTQAQAEERAAHLLAQGYVFRGCL